MSIKQNITSLQNLLEQVNALPDANSGGEDVADETAAYTEKLEELETAITALEAELEGKAAGGGVSVEAWTGTAYGNRGFGECPDVHVTYVDETLAVRQAILLQNEEITITVAAGLPIAVYDYLDLSYVENYPGINIETLYPNAYVIVPTADGFIING